MVLVNNTYSTPPVRLFVGSSEAVREQMVAHAGQTSTTHPSLRWILPSGGAYKRDDLEPFFEEVYRSRTENTPVFYLFPQADLLNESCANSMLKVLEEPPYATYFMLGASCADFVLSTIVSRSVLVAVGGASTPLASVLVAHFMRKTPQSYAQFMKLIESEEIDERKTRVLLDVISEQVQDAFRRAVAENDEPSLKKTEQVVRVISYAYDRLPMPGSAKTFWRTMYLLVG